MRTKENQKGYVRNSIIILREFDSIIFDNVDGVDFVAKMDGYAIIPKDQYELLLAHHKKTYTA